MLFVIVKVSPNKVRKYNNNDENKKFIADQKAQRLSDAEVILAEFYRIAGINYQG